MSAAEVIHVLYAPYGGQQQAYCGLRRKPSDTVIKEGFEHWGAVGIQWPKSRLCRRCMRIARRQNLYVPRLVTK